MSVYSGATIFKVTDQRLASRPNKDSSDHQLAETFLKRHKFLYIDMEDHQDSGFRVLSRQQKITSDSDEQAEVHGNEICITNLRTLSKGSRGMNKYLGLVRVETQTRSRINKVINKFKSIRKLETEPIQSLLGSAHKQQIVSQGQDVRQFLSKRRSRLLKSKTYNKEQRLLNCHCKVSDFCRIAKRHAKLNLETPISNKSLPHGLPRLSPRKPPNTTKANKSFQTQKNLFFKIPRY